MQVDGGPALLLGAPVAAVRAGTFYGAARLLRRAKGRCSTLSCCMFLTLNGVRFKETCGGILIGSAAAGARVWSWTGCARRPRRCFQR
ncbi:hypothetical protein EHS39_09790 [Ensifer sp. MPMI2T]|nr:hypothetical protein EHS39_09790 [Ensifer sp. MPMI2T]